jgi:hypothetical protein
MCICHTTHTTIREIVGAYPSEVLDCEQVFFTWLALFLVISPR